MHEKSVVSNSIKEAVSRLVPSK